MFYPFELERFFAKHEFTSKYLLCCSDPQSYTIRELIDLSEDPAKVREEFESLHLGYTESSGDPELRELVADLLYNGQGSNVNFNQENILIHTGAQEVIFTSCKGILKEGDKVMIQTPCYQSHYELPRSLGCEIIEIPTTINEEGKWDLDFKKIEQNIDESVKMLLINTPHNPTGFHFTLQQQKKLIDIIKPYDTILLADEVNRFSEHKDGLLLPSFAQIYNNCISISVLSKSFSLPGIRLGWAASQNLKLLEALVQCKDYTTITNPAPSEFLAKVALRNKEKILKRNLQIYQTNLNLFEQFLNKYSKYLEWVQPNSGIVGFLKLNWENLPSVFKQNVTKENTITNNFCDILLNEFGVLLAPGTNFDPSKSALYDHYVRLGFGRTNFPIALAKFEEFAKKYFK